MPAISADVSCDLCTGLDIWRVCYFTEEALQQGGSTCLLAKAFGAPQFTRRGGDDAKTVVILNGLPRRSLGEGGSEESLTIGLGRAQKMIGDVSVRAGLAYRST
jgi:hypothetical protein